MRYEKTQMVNDISNLLMNSEYIYVISYKGLSVSAFTDFRKKLNEHEAQCHVCKNTLIKKAIELNKLEKWNTQKFKDDTALVTGNGDPSETAKLISLFAKDFEAVSPKGGIVEGDYLESDDVKSLASLPSKDVLYSQLLGVLQGPQKNFVTALNSAVSGIVNVINSYKNKKEEN